MTTLSTSALSPPSTGESSSMGTALRRHLPFVLFMAVLIATEIGCARLAWHTIGEIVSDLLLMLVWFNVLPILIYALKGRTAAVVLALVWSVFLIPLQLLLGFKWYLLHQETLRIVTYVEQTRRQTGSYPKTLQGYKFNSTELGKEITYTYYKPDDFSVRFHIGTENTEHWYEAGSGWWYYPD